MGKKCLDNLALYKKKNGMLIAFFNEDNSYNLLLSDGNRGQVASIDLTKQDLLDIADKIKHFVEK